MSFIAKYKRYNIIKLIFISYKVSDDITNYLIKIIKKFEDVPIRNLINKSLTKKVSFVNGLLPLMSSFKYMRQYWLRTDPIGEDEYFISRIYNYYFGSNYYEINNISGLRICNISFLDI